MKKLIIIVCLLTGLGSQAQEFRWVRGGGGSFTFGAEQIRDMAVDADGNVFFVATVFGLSINVNGVIKTSVSSVINQPIVGIFGSFDCQGNNRFVKILSTSYEATYSNLDMDAEGNVYVTGYHDISGPLLGFQGIQFDTDLTIPFLTTGTQFFAKYTSNGDLLWVKHLQNYQEHQAALNELNYAGISELNIDNEGNIIMHVFAKNTAIFNNAFQITDTTGRMFKLKLDADGNFISGVKLAVNNLEFPHIVALAPRLYFDKATNHTLISVYVNSQDGGPPFYANENTDQLTNLLNLLVYDENGAFLWRKHNNQAIVGFNQEPVTDSEGNVYFKAAILGNSTELNLGETFDGEAVNVLVGQEYRGNNFVQRYDAAGNRLWHSYAQRSDAINTGLVVNGNEVVSAQRMKNFIWDNRLMTPPANDPNDSNPGLIRLEKDTGRLIDMTTILTQPGVSFDDNPNMLIADNNHNLYMAGSFSESVIGPNQIYMNGGSPDFFLAKYGSPNCGCEVPYARFRADGTTTPEVVNFFYQGQEVYDTVSWNFGDNTPTSSEINPVHTFANPGTYNVCVTATNQCGTHNFCRQINTATLSVSQPNFNKINVQVFPNPTTDFCQVDYELKSSNATIELYDLQGRILKREIILEQKGTWHIDTQSLKTGTYMIVVKENSQVTGTLKLLKR